jgi:hypothetical protein
MTISIPALAHVGTTYKRALTKKIPVRDHGVSACPAHKGAFGNATRYRVTCNDIRSTEQDLRRYRDTPTERTTMRKPKDFDTALRTLTDKTKALKENKRRQLGELIVATGADALDIEILAGGLLAMVDNKDAAQKESWRKQGAAFFRGKEHEPTEGTGSVAERPSASDIGRKPA